MKSLNFSQAALLLLFFFQASFSQNDCTDAIVVCGNSNFSGLSAVGIGTQELLSGSNTCSSQENNSIWLKVTIESSGTLAFTLIPQSRDISVDFDFFIFGPAASCGSIGTAIRCSTTNPEAAGSRNNHTGLNNSESDTSEGPGAAGNNFVSAITASAGETYYIVIDRPVGTSNFALDWTGSATFSSTPTVNTPAGATTLDLSKCDSDGTLDNSTPFNLDTQASAIIGTQTDVVATFHTTINDAVTNDNAIPNTSSYSNTANPQKIHIRLTNTLTGCFTTAEIDLEVTPFTTNDPADLRHCDYDNNGFINFDLTQNDATLIGSATDLTVTYHTSVGSAPIPAPGNYINSAAFTNETIWAKITNTAGCFAYKSFNIIVNRIPATAPANLTQCDFQLSPDGLTTFNLTEANNDLIGANNYRTQFFALLSDAQANSNELDPTFQNTLNPQVLYVRVTDTTTSCYTFTTVTLNVTVNPTITVALRECDADGTEDGFTEFDLTETEFSTGGNTVTYYLNSNDALLEQNQIPTNYTNTVSGQRLYARIENGNDCIGINIVDLFVDTLPQIEITDSAIFCLNLPTTPVVLNAGLEGQDSALFTYLWTPNGETTPEIDAFSSGTYTVTVKNAAGCTKLRTITVTDSDLAVVESVSVTDMSENNTITVYVEGDENGFLYSLDLPTGPFQESNHFENVTPGIHYVYIKDIENCGIKIKEVPVLGIPSFFTPNGDGYNDTWKIPGMEKGHYPNSRIEVYDRYGKLLKQVATAGDGWDGIYNDRILPATDYWYVIYLEDGRTIKGHFALKR